jgi:Ca-activated chloride channel family protein
VIPRIDFASLSFQTPLYLWLLVAPGFLLVVWIWRLSRRRSDARRLGRSRVLPVRERIPIAGDLAFWFCVLVAAAFCIVALAGPRARVSAIRRASADIVILQDGSASMYTRDVAPDRWRRSIRFLRTLAENLSWRGDRVALALFAHIASPQVRLTKDPNALFFFLDHLGDHSPFRLEDTPTWDTNIEEGIRWGVRLVQADAQLFGKSANPKAFIVVTDGQAWSGTVANALQQARDQRIPVYVVGVGTTSGGIIPEPATPPKGEALPAVAIRAVLDRPSLVQIAVAGGGEYFELGHEPDRDVALKILDRVRRRAAGAQEIDSYDELYWRALFAAAVVLCLGTLLLRKRTELWLQAGGVAVTLMILTILA